MQTSATDMVERSKKTAPECQCLSRYVKIIMINEVQSSWAATGMCNGRLTLQSHALFDSGHSDSVYRISAVYVIQADSRTGTSCRASWSGVDYCARQNYPTTN